MTDPMTTPRDPIEAPATGNAAADSLREKLVGIYENTIVFDRAELRSASLYLDIALATERRLARDEGRQEAVREIRAITELFTADRPERDTTENALNCHRALHDFLDDVARHGRSSDPTEADDER